MMKIISLPTLKTLILTIMSVGVFMVLTPATPAVAQCLPDSKCFCKGPCPSAAGSCSTGCACVSTAETGTADKPTTTTGHITDEFKKHRDWMTRAFFADDKRGDPVGLLAAMKLMTVQLTTIGMQQVQIIGTFFDAKHQLETQRLFQQLAARAHKDYHPSEELCEFGTAIRSLAPSARSSDLSAMAISKHALERQLMSAGATSAKGEESDENSRLKDFIDNYCNKLDNSKALDLLCKNSNAKPENYNRDIDFTASVDAPLTLDLDFSAKGAALSDDEKALFALQSYLFSHEILPFKNAEYFINDKGEPSYAGGAQAYMDVRALAAKRSVAANSIASIAALKAKGDSESQPFLYALIKEMGGDDMDVNEIKELIGENPSYYAQMEILTKKLYQNPEFYSNLYDKPANVMRKDVAVQAATLMQKRDLYRSYLRSEMIFAVMLETALQPEQDRITNEISRAPRGRVGRELGN